MTNIPTLTELFSSISSDIKSKFGIQSENDLKRVLSALAASDAGMLKLFYIALSDVQKNIWPDKADPESMGGTLERFGRVKLGRDPYVATQGKYIISITGVEGTILKSGTQFVNKNTGFYYTSTDAVTIGATSTNVEVVADNPGTGYVLATGDIIYTVNTIPNIDSLATVSSVELLPTDDEDVEAYRALVLQSFRLEPNGGSAADYVYWALDIAGIRTVYPYTTAAGAGTIFVEAEEDYSSDGNGSASDDLMKLLWNAADKTGVYELDPDTTQDTYLRGRRPLGFVNLSLISVTPQAVVVTITNLKTTTDTVKASISSAIKSMLFYKRPFCPGVGDVNDRKDTLYFKDIVSTLDSVLDSGNTYDDVSVTVAGKPLPNQFLNGDIPYLSEVIYD